MNKKRPKTQRVIETIVVTGLLKMAEISHKVPGRTLRLIKLIGNLDASNELANEALKRISIAT